MPIGFQWSKLLNATARLTCTKVKRYNMLFGNIKISLFIRGCVVYVNGEALCHRYEIDKFVSCAVRRSFKYIIYIGQVLSLSYFTSISSCPCSTFSSISYNVRQISAQRKREKEHSSGNNSTFICYKLINFVRHRGLLFSLIWFRFVSIAIWSSFLCTFLVWTDGNNAIFTIGSYLTRTSSRHIYVQMCWCSFH